jgi:hypothetical protein
MSLPSRLSALEKAARAAGFVERCAKCGFPAQHEPPITLLNYGDPEPDVCRECGHQVDADGRSVVQLGLNGPIKPAVIILQSKRRESSLPTISA